MPSERPLFPLLLSQARGVPLFDKGRFFDLPRHLARMLLDFRDISSSAFWFLCCQNFLTLWSFLITLVSVTFFAFYKPNGRPLAAQLDWVLICSVAVLPAVGFLWIAYLRRERALDEMAKGKQSAGRAAAACLSGLACVSRIAAASLRCALRRKAFCVGAVRVLLLGILSAHRSWVPGSADSQLPVVQVWRSGTVLRALRGVLSTSPHPNVCAPTGGAGCDCGRLACVPAASPLLQQARVAASRSTPRCGCDPVERALRDLGCPRACRYYPYMGFKSAMVHIALERTRQVS